MHHAYLVSEDLLGLGANAALPHLVEDVEEERVLLPEHLWERERERENSDRRSLRMIHN